MEEIFQEETEADN